MQTREYHRVRIRLSARLRWTTPLGQKIELAQTLNVSRSGLLLSTKEFHDAGASLWVTFPYDAWRFGLTPWSGSGEFRASVVRVSPAPDGVALDVTVCRES